MRQDLPLIPIWDLDYREEMYEEEEMGEENESDTSDEDEEEGGDDMDVSN